MLHTVPTLWFRFYFLYFLYSMISGALTDKVSLPYVTHKYGSLFVISRHRSAQVEQCCLLCSVQVDEFGVVVYLLATLVQEGGK